MAENKIIGYKKMFGFVMPDWVDERVIKLIAWGLLSVAVMFLVLIFLIWPNFAVIETKESQLKSEREQLSFLKNSKQGLDRFQSDLDKTELDVVLSAMPLQYSPETAIYMLRAISNDSGVTITSYSLPSGVLMDSSPSIPSPQKTAVSEMVQFSTFPIKISVSAPIESLLKFISKVESSLPFGVVSDLNLQEVTKLSKTVTGKSVQLSLEIVFYQSILKSINLSKVVPLTTEDITLAKELTRFNTVPKSATPSETDFTASGSGAASGNIFGM